MCFVYSCPLGPFASFSEELRKFMVIRMVYWVSKEKFMLRRLQSCYAMGVSLERYLARRNTYLYRVNEFELLKVFSI